MISFTLEEGYPVLLQSSQVQIGIVICYEWDIKNVKIISFSIASKKVKLKFFPLRLLQLHVINYQKKKIIIIFNYNPSSWLDVSFVPLNSKH